jgi:hypothetical protein
VENGITDEQFWSYVPGFESPDQYEAFEHYRDSGPRLRSLAGTSRALRIGYGTVVTWAREKGWDERVLAYDAHRIAQRAELARAREQEQDVAWAEKRTELLERWHGLLSEELVRFEASLRKRSGSMRPNELTRALDVLIKYSNLANGDATERIDVPIDLSNHTPEQLAALEGLRALQRKSE